MAQEIKPKSLNPQKQTRPRKRDRAGTERAILKAAGELFAKKGYENTRTLEIAKAANANEALITRYFGGKEGLLTAILSDPEAFTEMLAGKTECVAEVFKAPESGLTLQEAVEDFLRQGREVIQERQQFMRISCSRSLVDPKMASIVRQQIIDRKVPMMIEAVGRFVDRKKVRIEEIEAAVILILSSNFMLNFMGRHIYQFGDDRVAHATHSLAQMIGESFAGRTVAVSNTAKKPRKG
jgi:AcrR family transcriptional regulator